VGVRGDDVHEPGAQQLESDLLHPAPEAPRERARGDLRQHPLVHERPQAADRVGVEGRAALRVGQQDAVPP
jgi:hypothetical protein